MGLTACPSHGRAHSASGPSPTRPRSPPHLCLAAPPSLLPHIPGARPSSLQAPGPRDPRSWRAGVRGGACSDQPGHRRLLWAPPPRPPRGACPSLPGPLGQRPHRALLGAWRQRQADHRSPRLISVNTVVGWVVLHPRFAFLLNHTGKLETSLPPSVFNPFSALCRVWPPCRPAHVHLRLPATSAVPTCASPQPRPPPSRPQVQPRAYSSSPSLPQWPRVTKALPPQACFLFQKMGRVRGRGDPSQASAVTPPPAVPARPPQAPAAPRAQQCCKGTAPQGGTLPSPSCRGGRSRRGGAAADPRNAVRALRSHRRPAMLFLHPLCRPPGGRRGTGQALLSLRHVQVRGPSGAPPGNPTGVRSLGRKQHAAVAEADGRVRVRVGVGIRD